MTSHTVQMLFVDLALILLLARGFGVLAVRLGQPPVIGEIFAGILLGPTLFDGWIAANLFPAAVRPLLSGMADVGVALFMFVVGLELERGVLRGKGRNTAVVAAGSTLLPFVLGLGLGWYLWRGHGHGDAVAFVVFVGLSVSVTAFPVLARIIADRGLARTGVGAFALAAAAVVDVVAWVALAAVQAAIGGEDGQWRVLLLLPYVAVMFLAVRPLLRRLVNGGDPGGPLSVPRLAALLSGALLSAAATEAMGMHFIFGAFLFGLVMPTGAAEPRSESIQRQTGQLTALLLPVYFVVAGFKVDLGGIGLGGLLDFGAILLVAVAGKLGGTYLAARVQGVPARASLALGTLLNTRGLTELIILGVGLRIGLLDGSLYSLMVVMALVTTAMTGPMLAWIYRRPVEITASARGPALVPAARSSA
ncbi:MULTISPECIES: cation:proton antiporter [Micromonospora]|uniref:Cation/H(+) antiporter n=1 Tax=Micromonospora solifontis TaxID=2487138 RepID=A0ABX9WFG6_9ACTN|nr:MULTISPECIES: cation:proton antiporter [Micromonospora]NES15077.1 cation/H(+) antiporter [Micromonospora sp. PPF5-17B]NES37177.1 cation/H(+) antiporter [Micromonospora solifontis]NES56248.1 cation/H(+) antiporter [Micromonospora sp. PPF5-6]RNL98626.1 cation/H(+) antiporter [Micromonospora solifontis]